MYSNDCSLLHGVCGHVCLPEHITHTDQTKAASRYRVVISTDLPLDPTELSSGDRAKENLHEIVGKVHRQIYRIRSPAIQMTWCNSMSFKKLNLVVEPY